MDNVPRYIPRLRQLGTCRSFLIANLSYLFEEKPSHTFSEASVCTGIPLCDEFYNISTFSRIFLIGFIIFNVTE